MSEQQSSPGSPLAGRVIVITGASRGLGKALAMRFSEHGASLGLIARNEIQLADLASSLATDVVTVGCDVTDKNEVEKAFQRIGEKMGTVDVVVANAGGQSVARSAHQLPIEKWREMIELNLTGAYITAQSGYHYLCNSNGGRLLFVSSSAARIPASKMCAYAAAKAGVEGLTRALSVDWSADGICVNALSVGLIENSGSSSMPRKLREQVVKKTLLNRPGNLREFTDVATFLAGIQSSYITGQVLSVDGGFGLGW